MAGLFAGALILMAGGAVLAQEPPGKCSVFSIGSKPIDGQQYEDLYSRICDVGEAAGAKINVALRR